MQNQLVILHKSKALLYLSNGVNRYASYLSMWKMVSNGVTFHIDTMNVIDLYPHSLYQCGKKKTNKKTTSYIESLALEL